ncbi:hypothetical protein TNCV_2168711 [Trichonephila clavipes]|nr:hypothetical protein TNCV_2168711 [Trichonephila clavipes]
MRKYMGSIGGEPCDPEPRQSVSYTVYWLITNVLVKAIRWLLTEFPKGLSSSKKFKAKKLSSGKPKDVGNVPRKFEPWSRGEDDINASPSLSKLPHLTNMQNFELRLMERVSASVHTA